MNNMMSYQTEVAVGTTPATAANAQDEMAVRQLFQAQMAAWDAGDAEAYGALFTEDADYLAFDGVNQKGRAAIVAGHKPLFEKFLKGSRLTGDIVSLCFLAPDVAIAHTMGSIIDAGRSTPKPERLSSQTMIAVKQNGIWRFKAFHNTRIRPIGGGLRGVIAWALADLAWKLVGPK